MNDDIADLIDYSASEPTLAGKPLWLLPLDEEQVKLATALWERSRAANALVNYSQYAVLDPETHPATHHKIICDAIDGLLNDDYDDLVINTPPGAAKSTYTSHALGAYFMGRYPRKNIILATHTADLSEKCRVRCVTRWQTCGIAPYSLTVPSVKIQLRWAAGRHLPVVSFWRRVWARRSLGSGLTVRSSTTR